MEGSVGGEKGGSAEWSRGHSRERVRVVQLACLWFPPHLLWWPWMFRHLGGETMVAVRAQGVVVVATLPGGLAC